MSEFKYTWLTIIYKIIYYFKLIELKFFLFVRLACCMQHHIPPDECNRYTFVSV